MAHYYNVFEMQITFVWFKYKLKKALHQNQCDHQADDKTNVTNKHYGDLVNKIANWADEFSKDALGELFKLIIWKCRSWKYKSTDRSKNMHLDQLVFKHVFPSNFLLSRCLVGSPRELYPWGYKNMINPTCMLFHCISM